MVLVAAGDGFGVRDSGEHPDGQCGRRQQDEQPQHPAGGQPSVGDHRATRRASMMTFFFDVEVIVIVEVLLDERAGSAINTR